MKGNVGIGRDAWNRKCRFGVNEDVIRYLTFSVVYSNNTI